MKIGYARVSTLDQNLDMQLDALEKEGCDIIYQEKISGMKKDRPELDKMLEYIRPGDQVVVYKLDRISRSTRHLIELAELFDEKKVDFVSISDKIDTSTPMGKFFFTILAAQAQLERDILSERTKDGLQAARARGRVGGRPSVDDSIIDAAIKMYLTTESAVREIAVVKGVAPSTLYKYLTLNGYRRDRKQLGIGRKVKAEG